MPGAGPVTRRRSKPLPGRCGNIVAFSGELYKKRQAGASAICPASGQGRLLGVLVSHVFDSHIRRSKMLDNIEALNYILL